jgi:hypothetical protein
MRQNNGFDWFPEFKSKGIEFEVGDKYLFRQLTGLLIHQSCQANSPCFDPHVRHNNKKEKLKDQVEDLKI